MFSSFRRISNLVNCKLNKWNLHTTAVVVQMDFIFLVSHVKFTHVDMADGQPLAAN